MYGAIKEHLESELSQIKQAGLFKDERVLLGAQGARIPVGDGRRVINMCANNYLGLASHPAVIEAARDSFERWGYGLSSVRFICGTQQQHKQLEQSLATFLGTDDAILYTSCFDANTGLFETLLGPDDAILSDSLNHASIIDGVRLCKARRLRYASSDMADLKEKLKSCADARFRMIATDGVFSMDGTFARLGEICDLADEHDALVMVDDSHAVGFVGPTGRGTHERAGVMGRVDLITGTLGKALGGASGGYTAGRAAIVQTLRQRSRPYLFSNTVAPAIVSASLKVLDLLSKTGALVARLNANTAHFRAGLLDRGFAVKEGEHPIIPIMLGEASLAQQMASQLLSEGVYVIGFSYPVVPHGQARIRVQISAAHSTEDLDFALDAFERVGRGLAVVGREHRR